MTKFEKMVGALKTSITETVAANRADRDEALAKSVEQFGDAVAELFAEQQEALAKAAPDAAAADPVAHLGAAVQELAKAIQDVEQGRCVLMTGATPPSAGTMELLKAATDLAHNGVLLMAAEQATPIESEAEAEEGLGLMKLETADGELLVKHALSEQAMGYLVEPSAAHAEALESAVYALQVLGVDAAPLLKSFPEEGEDEEADEDEGEGAEGEGDEGDEGDEGEGEDGSPDPLTSLAQIGLAAVTTVASLREAAEAEGATEEELSQLDQLAQHGAFITVVADKLLTQAEEEPPEGEEAPAPDEAEMALAARSAEMAKAAREYILKHTPKDELAKAAGTPTGEAPMAKAAEAKPATPAKAAAPEAPKAPMLKAVAVDKLEDSGGALGETLEQRAERLAKMAPGDRQVELLKESFKNPIPV